jgi:hypothetical protein
LSLGRVDQAYGDLKLMLYLAESVKSEPIVISQLVRFACHQSVLQILWEGLAAHQWSDPQIKECQSRLEGMNLLADNLRAMDSGERAGMGHGIFEYVRRNPAMLSRLSSPTPESENAVWDFLFLAPIGWFYLEEINFNELFTTRVLLGDDAGTQGLHPRVIEANGDKLYKAIHVHPYTAIVEHKVLSALLLPSLVSIHKRTAAAQCYVDEAAIACALERYRLKNGTIPDSLQTLTPEFLSKIPHDVIGGQPLKYQRTNGSFLLYSIGWNEKDDDGKVGLNKHGKPDPDQGDWVWSYPAK